VTVDRMLESDEARELIGLTREIAAAEIAPGAGEADEQSRFPREVFDTLGKAGLLSLAYPEEYGGGAQSQEVYLQVVEEVAAASVAAAVGMSVQTLACFPVAACGTDEQRERFLPELLSGRLLGAYCLSEPHCGSDAAALTTRAERDGDDDYVVSGTKAWVTHGGVADFYNVFCRTGDAGSRGISVLLVPADTDGLDPQPPEHKMGLRASPTTQIVFDGARVPADRVIGGEGNGFQIAMNALDGGRLGIAACAVGLAQAALDAAVAYAADRTAFGRPISEHQGVSFTLADMAAGVAAARALYLDAARRRDAGKAFGPQAAMAKLVASETAMRVTTDAVQVFGGAGYTTDYPVERYLREAKVLQIVEGTSGVQRLVIGRSLTAYRTS
jgi:alkylation response protein AidB-like acyl-CoA dehydrogenase